MIKNKNKGSSDGDKSVDINVDTLEKNGDDKNIDVEKSKLNELEALKERTAGKDQKITELLESNKKLVESLEAEKKAREEKENAGKSAKELNEVYKKKVELYEKQNAFRKAFKDCELDANEWSFINGQDYSVIANNIKTIFEREKEAYANKKLEEFKNEKLSKIQNNIPNSDDDIEPYDDPIIKLVNKIKNNN